MLKLFVVLGTLLMLMPVASANVSAISVNPITTGSSPGVNVTLANGDSYDISYSYLLLIATLESSTFQKMIVFGADLQNQNWTIDKVGKSGNITYTYSTNMTLTPTTRSPLGYGNASFLPPDSVPASIADKLFPRVQMNVVVTQTSDTDSIVVFNQSSGNGNATYRNLSISTLTIDNYINVTYFPPASLTFLTMNGGGSFLQEYRVELLQGINAHVSGRVPLFQRFNGSASAMSHHIIPIGGLALRGPNGPGNVQGLFWWPSNYTSGNVTQPVQPYIVTSPNGVDLGFQYFGNSSTAIIQDPYFSILNTTLNGQIINEKLQQAYKEIVENFSLFGAGIFFGSVLIVLSYSVYRRRRI